MQTTCIIKPFTFNPGVIAMVSNTPARLFLRNVAPEHTTTTVWSGLQRWGLGAGVQHVHAARPRGYQQGNPVNYYVTYDTLQQVNNAVQVLDQQIFLSVRPVLAQVASPRDDGKSYPSQLLPKVQVEGCTPKMGPPMTPWRATQPPPPPPVPKAAVQASCDGGDVGDEDLGRVLQAHFGQKAVKEEGGGEKKEGKKRRREKE